MNSNFLLQGNIAPYIVSYMRLRSADPASANYANALHVITLANVGQVIDFCAFCFYLY